MDERTAGLRGVDDITSAKLLVREFVTFSARNPQLHRIIMQESKADGPRTPSASSCSGAPDGPVMGPLPLLRVVRFG